MEIKYNVYFMSGNRICKGTIVGEVDDTVYDILVKTKIAEGYGVTHHYPRKNETFFSREALVDFLTQNVYGMDV